MLEFARPEMLWGLPLAAAPLIIHLLNRRRYRSVRWAAMDFLLTATRRRRRRVQVQNVLLLALRTLAIVLIVLLFARPRSTSSVGTLHGGHVLLLLDDSASMAQLDGGEPVFERAKAFAMALAQRAAEAEAAMSLHLPGLLEPLFEAETMTTQEVTRLRKVLAGLQPSATVLDLTALNALAASAGPQPTFYVVTDLRAADWGAAELTPAARRGLTALQQHGPLRIVDVGAEPGPNGGVLAVDVAGRFVHAGRQAVLRAVVEGARARALQVRLDGRPLPALTAPPSGRGTVPIDVLFAAPGAHVVEVTFASPDTFPPDDHRWLALRADARVPVLIVEGAAGEAVYLRAALQPERDAASGLAPEVVSAGAGPPADLGGYAAVFVCGLPTPGAWRDALARYANGGGRLVVFLGERAEAGGWADLLPCRAEAAVRPDAQSPARIGAVEFGDPLLTAFSGLDALFAAPRFRAFHRLLAQPGTRVPLRFDDADSSPALVVGSRGRGLVAVFPFPADDSWTDWPRSEVGRASYVLLVQWLVEWGEAPWSHLNLTGGQRLLYPLEGGLYRFQATLVPPGGDGEAGTVLQAHPVDGREGLWFVSEPLRTAGAWQLRLQTADGRTEALTFAVNVPAAERQPQRTDADVVLSAATAPGWLAVVSADGPDLDAATPERWLLLAAVALVVLAGESLLAFALGNPRVDPRGGRVP